LDLKLMPTCRKLIADFPVRFRCLDQGPNMKAKTSAATFMLLSSLGM
jgi:hypothetical protein